MREKKRADAQHQFYIDYYRSIGNLSGKRRKRKRKPRRISTSCGGVKRRYYLMTEGPDRAHIRKQYLDGTNEAEWKAADERVKAEAHANEERAKLRLKELAESKKDADAKFEYDMTVARKGTQEYDNIAHQKLEVDKRYLEQQKAVVAASGLSPTRQQQLFPDIMGTSGTTKADTAALKADQELADQRSRIAVQNAQAALKSDQEAERSALQRAQSRAQIEDQTADHLAAVQTKIVQDS